MDSRSLVFNLKKEHVGFVFQGVGIGLQSRSGVVQVSFSVNKRYSPPLLAAVTRVDCKPYEWVEITASKDEPEKEGWQVWESIVRTWTLGSDEDEACLLFKIRT